MLLLPKKRRAFTLVELLIVIFIIALLITVGATTFSKSQAAGRNGKRAADINLIATALEQYYQDQGFYPATYQAGGNPHAQTAGYYGDQDVINCLLGSPAADAVTYTIFNCRVNKSVIPNVNIPGPYKAYLPKIPTDPRATTCSTNNYVYLSDGQTYTLITQCYEGTAPIDHILAGPYTNANLIWKELHAWQSSIIWENQYTVTSKPN